MSTTREIGREDWGQFLNVLNREAAGRPVRIEVDSEELGDQEVVRQLPFSGVELTTHGGGPGSLEVSAGNGGGQINHQIAHPTRMYLLEDDAGRLSCLSIEDEAGGKTLVYFLQLLEFPVGEEVAPA